ncbi:MAG TPA: glycosyltransferase [Candidatus Woesebacteria bacterium]|nr:glycosyltransferase [Candidatus Woesebacteria bacterium]
MKILFIEPCHINFGGYYRALNICKGLARNGIKVDLLVTTNKKLLLKIKKRVVEKNLTIFELPRIYLHFYINGRILRGFIATFFGLFKRYDIIHAAMPMQFESNIPAFILKLFGNKVVIDWDEIFEDTFNPNFLINRYIHFCEHKLPGFFKNYCVTSDVLYKYAQQRGAEKIIKIINGIDLKEFNPKNKLSYRHKLNLDKNTKYIFAYGNTFGSNRPYKFFKTFENIIKLDNSIKLLCNFDPMSIYKRDNLVGKINPKIFSNIINLGYISNKEYLYTSNLALFLSGDGICEKANYPIRISSYLGSNLIVALNDDNTEVSNSLKKEGCSILSSNLNTLGQKTVEFLHDSKIQKKYYAKLKTAKQHFSVENLSLKLIDFYKSI